VLTVFSIPKPFSSDVGGEQERAVASWSRLADGVQVVLVGDDEGVDAAAERLRAEHVAGTARTPAGTPRLDDAFRRVDAIARYRLRCFVNADIVLLPDLVPPLERVASTYERFLLVGQSRDVDVRRLEGIDPSAVRRVAKHDGVLRGPTAIDWFAFTAGIFDPMPPFAVGRAAFDNWMVWKARQAGPVIDATAAVVAVHQAHGYGHLAGGKDEAYYGAEAARNLELAGGSRRRYTLHDASHRMRADLSFERNYGSVLRARETARKIGWKLGVR
jgi:hypothetical protein